MRPDSNNHLKVEVASFIFKGKTQDARGFTSLHGMMKYIKYKANNPPKPARLPVGSARLCVSCYVDLVDNLVTNQSSYDRLFERR